MKPVVAESLNDKLKVFLYKTGSVNILNSVFFNKFLKQSISFIDNLCNNNGFILLNWKQITVADNSRINIEYQHWHQDEEREWDILGLRRYFSKIKWTLWELTLQETLQENKCRDRILYDNSDIMNHIV